VPHKGIHHLMLNPGLSYRLQEEDQCIFIAQNSKVVQEISDLVRNLHC
jgi:hypothetical protein